MNKFIFVHIEKCGGSTIHNWLKYYIPRYHSLKPFFLNTNEKKSELSINELKLLKFFHPKAQGFGGHRLRSFLNYDLLFNSKINYITFLRDPISRYLSHFNHQNKLNKYSIHEFLDNPQFNNFMCKKICGYADGEKAFLELKRNFSFVGFTDDFEKSIISLSFFLGKSNVKPFYQKKNKTININPAQLNEINEKFEEDILKNNLEDIKLYQKAFKFFKNINDDTCNQYIIKNNFDINAQSLEIKYNPIRALLLKFSKAYNKFISEPISFNLCKYVK